MKLVAFLNLIRWKNLLLILYVLVLFKFIVFRSFEIETNLSLIQFTTLLLSILSITAAGYIINDIYDLKIDLINKPKKVIVSKHFSIQKSQQFYLWLNSIGIILGIALCLHLELPSYSFIFIGTSLLLYYYSKKFKSKPLIGNIIVAFLTAFSIGIIYFFEINLTIHNLQQQLITQVILLVSTIAFFLNLSRELVKDIIDIKGDNNLNMNTLPILIGVDRTSKIAIIITLIPFIILLFIILNYAPIYRLTMLYLVVFVCVPLLYISVKLFSTKSKTVYKKISLYLKLIMFLGINSLIIFSINT